MTIIRNIIVAFSLYSRIPMPHFRWEKKDTKYVIAFLPWIGAIIGILEYLLLCVEAKLNVPELAKVFLWMVVPLIVTGGFHVDGFLDVQDALKSYKPKEEKLEILKDPHIGAFSVISLVIYGCIYSAATDCLLTSMNKKIINVVIISFFLVRGIAALLSITLKHAKKDGMLHEETRESNFITIGIVITEIMLGLVVMLCLSWLCTLVVGIVLGIVIMYYKSKCYKEFGGVTGDTIGYFIIISELAVLCAMAAISIAGRVL